MAENVSNRFPVNASLCSIPKKFECYNAYCINLNMQRCFSDNACRFDQFRPDHRGTANRSAFLIWLRVGELLKNYYNTRMKGKNNNNTGNNNGETRNEQTHGENIDKDTSDIDTDDDDEEEGGEDDNGNKKGKKRKGSMSDETRRQKNYQKFLQNNTKEEEVIFDCLDKINAEADDDEDDDDDDESEDDTCESVAIINNGQKKNARLKFDEENTSDHQVNGEPMETAEPTIFDDENGITTAGSHHPVQQQQQQPSTSNKEPKKKKVRETIEVYLQAVGTDSDDVFLREKITDYRYWIIINSKKLDPNNILHHVLTSNEKYHDNQLKRVAKTKKLLKPLEKYELWREVVNQNKWAEVCGVYLNQTLPADKETMSLQLDNPKHPLAFSQIFGCDFGLTLADDKSMDINNIQKYHLKRISENKISFRLPNPKYCIRIPLAELSITTLYNRVFMHYQKHFYNQYFKTLPMHLQMNLGTVDEYDTDWNATIETIEKSMRAGEQTADEAVLVITDGMSKMMQLHNSKTLSVVDDEIETESKLSNVGQDKKRKSDYTTKDKTRYEIFMDISRVIDPYKSKMYDNFNSKKDAIQSYSGGWTEPNIKLYAPMLLNEQISEMITSSFAQLRVRFNYIIGRIIKDLSPNSTLLSSPNRKLKNPTVVKRTLFLILKNCFLQSFEQCLGPEGTISMTGRKILDYATLRKLNDISISHTKFDDTLTCFAHKCIREYQEYEVLCKINDKHLFLNLAEQYVLDSYNSDLNRPHLNLFMKEKRGGASKSFVQQMLKKFMILDTVESETVRSRLGDIGPGLKTDRVILLDEIQRSLLEENEKPGDSNSGEMARIFKQTLSENYAYVRRSVQMEDGTYQNKMVKSQMVTCYIGSTNNDIVLTPPMRRRMRWEEISSGNTAKSRTITELETTKNLLSMTEDVNTDVLIRKKHTIQYMSYLVNKMMEVGILTPISSQIADIVMKHVCHQLHLRGFPEPIWSIAQRIIEHAKIKAMLNAFEINFFMQGAKFNRISRESNVAFRTFTLQDLQRIDPDLKVNLQEIIEAIGQSISQLINSNVIYLKYAMQHMVKRISENPKKKREIFRIKNFIDIEREQPKQSNKLAEDGDFQAAEEDEEEEEEYTGYGSDVRRDKAKDDFEKMQKKAYRYDMNSYNKKIETYDLAAYIEKYDPDYVYFNLRKSPSQKEEDVLVMFAHAIHSEIMIIDEIKNKPNFASIRTAVFDAYGEETIHTKPREFRSVPVTIGKVTTNRISSLPKEEEQKRSTKVFLFTGSSLSVHYDFIFDDVYNEQVKKNGDSNVNDFKFVTAEEILKEILVDMLNHKGQRKQRFVFSSNPEYPAYRTHIEFDGVTPDRKNIPLCTINPHYINENQKSQMAEYVFDDGGIRNESILVFDQDLDVLATRFRMRDLNITGEPINPLNLTKDFNDYIIKNVLKKPKDSSITHCTNDDDEDEEEEGEYEEDGNVNVLVKKKVTGGDEHHHPPYFMGEPLEKIYSNVVVQKQLSDDDIFAMYKMLDEDPKFMDYCTMEKYTDHDFNPTDYIVGERDAIIWRPDQNDPTNKTFFSFDRSRKLHVYHWDVLDNFQHPRFSSKLTYRKYMQIFAENCMKYKLLKNCLPYQEDFINRTMKLEVRQKLKKYDPTNFTNKTNKDRDTQYREAMDLIAQKMREEGEQGLNVVHSSKLFVDSEYDKAAYETSSFSNPFSSEATISNTSSNDSIGGIRSISDEEIFAPIDLGGKKKPKNNLLRQRKNRTTMDIESEEEEEETLVRTRQIPKVIYKSKITPLKEPPAHKKIVPHKLLKSLHKNFSLHTSSGTSSSDDIGETDEDDFDDDSAVEYEDLDAPSAMDADEEMEEDDDENEEENEEEEELSTQEKEEIVEREREIERMKEIAQKSKKMSDTDLGNIPVF